MMTEVLVTIFCDWGYYVIFQVTFVLLGARVVTEYVVAALNPFRR